jgi:penicillin amidase
VTDPQQQFFQVKRPQDAGEDLAVTLALRTAPWLYLRTMIPCWLRRAVGPVLPALAIVMAVGFGLSARAGEVEVLRDTWGTPHVFAKTEPDGFFGLGNSAAEDRLLQMELIRRKAAGRLAEVFGPDWVDSDRQARIAGHAAYAPRAFAKLPERWREALRAYAAGVNAWRQANPETVAHRFQPLAIQPEPWTPADCLLAARGILSLGSPFSAGPIEDYHRFRELVAQVGETEAARQSGMAIDDAVAIVSESEMAKDQAVYDRLKRLPRMPGFELRGAGGGGEPRKMSHAWAVGGRRSTTGKPILESDPQLPLSSPPFFYELHLAAGRIDARGLGIPGCPGLFIGWNRRIAWGASALGVDSQVFFLDRLTPDGKGYLFEDKPVPFERRLERIEVKGGQPVVQEVLSSRHGTVFNSLVRSPRAGEAYLCYDAQTMDDGASARMMLEVLDAGNWKEFRRALEHYYYPGLHIVYADVEGNVGYHTLVHRPLTARSPRRALEGWTGRDEVQGRVPFDELPHMLNPESGYVSHANNLPVGSWYPYDLGLATGGTGDTSRSLRLHQLLDGDRTFSVEDFERALHRDDVNPLVAALLPIARKVVEEDQVKDAVVLGLLDAVKGWDLHDGTADRFPAARGLANTLTPYRGSGLQNIYGAGGGGVSHLAREVGAQFARDGKTPTHALVRAYLASWLRASATGGAGSRGGASDESTVRISQARPAAAREAGRTITIPYQRTIPHNLSVVDASLDVVSPPLTCLDQGTIWSQPGNLYSQIVDLSDVDNSRSMMAPGNAEDGRFRTNQVDLWVKGTTHPAPLSRTKLEALGVISTKLMAIAYAGPSSSSRRTVTESDRAARFVPAIPPAVASTNTEARPLPGRKPDDPTLEAAFRYLLRSERTPAELDAKLDEVQQFVSGNPALEAQLREALKLGVYLIEESRAGRLKVEYGTPYCLERMRKMLNQFAPQPEKASPLPAGREAKPHGRMEEMRPDELEQVLAEAPIAFVPLGTFEHHGWHLPVCFDAIKAHALCERVAERTGGTVLPTFYYGTGGGHVGYKWTLMLPEPQITPLIEATLDHLARQGFKVVVVLTGHYPKEQVDMVHRLAREARGRHPRVRFIGLTEPEITTPQPGDAYGGDHAAKYETSIALALNPDWVRLDQLTPGREPTRVTLPDTPRKEAATHDPTHPLYAIHGQDPRITASKELGEKLVAEIVSRLAGQVEEALNGVIRQTKP